MWQGGSVVQSAAVSNATKKVTSTKDVVGYGTIKMDLQLFSNKETTNNLRFGVNDLVYGPSSGGKLVKLKESAGGKLLSDVGNPYDAGYGSDWLKYSTHIIDSTVQAGNKIHFDLTYMDDIQGILNNTGIYANKVTAGELRYIRDNWFRLDGSVKFYIDGKEIPPPWVNWN